MIRRHYSLEHADLVLAMLERSLSTKHRTFALSVWSNGREQGYHIRSSIGNGDSQAALVFAQQRGSDAIVVIVGTTTDFDITTHMPNEAVGEKQKCFASDVEAAAFITEYLLYYPMKELLKP